MDPLLKLLKKIDFMLAIETPTPEEHILTIVDYELELAQALQKESESSKLNQIISKLKQCRATKPVPSGKQYPVFPILDEATGNIRRISFDDTYMFFQTLKQLCQIQQSKPKPL